MNFQEGIRQFSALGEEFATVVLRLTREWEPAQPPTTLMMAEFADVISGAARSGGTERVRDALALVEVLLKSGCAELKDAAATGLLEKLLADASSGKLDFTLIAPFLGELSKFYCREWDRFTGMKTDGLWAG